MRWCGWLGQRLCHAGLVGQEKGFGTYSKNDKKPLQGFEQVSDMMYYLKPYEMSNTQYFDLQNIGSLCFTAILKKNQLACCVENK